MVVDASQGVEAQTVANLYLALEYDLELLPVINKIDLPAADVDRVREEIDADLGLDPFEAIPVSAKTGEGIDDVLAGINVSQGDLMPKRDVILDRDVGARPDGAQPMARDPVLSRDPRDSPAARRGVRVRAYAT